MKSWNRQVQNSTIGIIGLLFCGLMLSCVQTPDSILNSNVPPAPVGVKTTGATITTISLSWNPVAGATSYTVYYTVDGTSPSSSNSYDYNTTTLPTITFTPTSTAYGLPVNIVVTATNDNGEGNPSAVVIDTTIVPMNVVATSLDNLKMQITWNAVAGATSYNVYHTFNKLVNGTAPTESNYANMKGSITSTTSTWTTVEADSGDYFHYAVSAVNANGEGGLSAVATAQAIGSPAIPVSNLPVSPTGVITTGATITTLSVEWNAVTSATSYTVYYTVDGTSPSTNNYYDYTNTSMTTLTFTPTSSAFGLPINIAVTATNSYGEGNPSPVVIDTTLVPTNVVATSVGGGTRKMNITWNAVPGAITYNVYHTYGKSATGTGPTKSSSENSGRTSTSFSWTAAVADTNDYYHFAISAVNAAGEGGLSAVATAQAK